MVRRLWSPDVGRGRSHARAGWSHHVIVGRTTDVARPMTVSERASAQDDRILRAVRHVVRDGCALRLCLAQDREDGAGDDEAGARDETTHHPITFAGSCRAIARRTNGDMSGAGSIRGR